jgi:hypothetical protein
MRIAASAAERPAKGKEVPLIENVPLDGAHRLHGKSAIFGQIESLPADEINLSEEAPQIVYGFMQDHVLSSDQAHKKLCGIGCLRLPHGY